MHCRRIDRVQSVSPKPPTLHPTPPLTHSLTGFSVLIINPAHCVSLAAGHVQTATRSADHHHQTIVRGLHFRNGNPTTGNDGRQAVVRRVRRCGYYGSESVAAVAEEGGGPAAGRRAGQGFAGEERGNDEAARTDD